MLEGIVAIIGAVLGLFIYRAFGQKATDSGQKALEAKIEADRKKDESLLLRNSEIDKNEKTKVEEITNEQNKDQSTSDLVDFFNRPKGK